MNPIDKNIILELLSEWQALLQGNDNFVIENFQSLKQRVIQLELKDEMVALRVMTESEDFIEAFKTHCKARAKVNANTCLSFFAMPHGVCNKSYWKLAFQLLPTDSPKTLGMMLDILCPELIVVTPEFQVSQHDRIYGNYFRSNYQ